MIEKPKGKRISDYETDDGLYYLTQLYRDYGYTDKMTAEAIGISRMTLTNWKKKSQKINHAISIGKSYMDTHRLKMLY